ncbi:FACT complex subunit SSRP1, partial [Glycine soja]
MFTTILCGLFGAKVTKPGKLRSRQDGYAVKSSLEAEDGILYPLEKNFFFLPKPPTLILHEEIDYVEFEWHAGGGSNMHYFDLLFRLKSEQEHLFRNIQRNEYHNLYEFISSKGLKITNLGDAQPTVGIKKVLENDDDDAVDPHLKHIKMKLAEMKVTRRMMKVLLLMIMGQAILMAVMMRKRQNLKKTNHGVSFTNAGRVLGEKWKKLSRMAGCQLFHFMQFHRVSFMM